MNLINWALDRSSRARKCAWKADSFCFKTLSRQRRYVVTRLWWCQTGIKGQRGEIRTADGALLARLSPDGRLELYPGFIWDGPSGPTYDTLDSMAASAAHDALYRMHRRRQIAGHLRDEVDALFKRILLQDGMYEWRATMWYDGVRVGARWAWEG